MGAVMLLSMPFGQLQVPSIGLSLIRGQLELDGIAAKIRYFTFEFARLIGAELYSDISAGMPANVDMLGEWIFSHEVSEQTEEEIEGYLNHVLRGENPHHRKPEWTSRDKVDRLIERALAARGQVSNFLDLCVEEIIATAPSVIGLTSVFQQNCASLALAKRVKQKLPSTFIVMGGANCEGLMGRAIVDQFQFIDAVISGEGEYVLPALIKHLDRGHPIGDLSGVISRSRSSLVTANTNSSVIQNLDLLPIPDYRDYFEQLGASGLSGIEPTILFETSRGCWWGEKSHCTFCGLNGSTMKFRSKSVTRALSELSVLASSYPTRSISVVDNIIDYRYFKDFLPQLAAMSLPIKLFYEVKANLKKEQIRTLKSANVSTIQPGIESLSDEVLSLMGKGVRAIQNLQLLKWCKEIGIKAEWNLLWGFPGESAEAYSDMSKLIPYLTHFDAPAGSFQLRLDRFSPNHNQWKSRGFASVTAFPSYSYIYRQSESIVDKLAYYFTFEYADGRSAEAYTRDFSEATRYWRQVDGKSDLFYIEKGHLVLVWDFRPIALRHLYVLCGDVKTLYLFCDQGRTLTQILQANDVWSGSAELLESRIRELVQAGLMVEIGSFFLSLAVSAHSYSPSAETLQAMLEFLYSENAVDRNGDTTSLNLDQFVV